MTRILMCPGAWLLLAAVLSAARQAPARVDVEVTADHVNLRAAPEAQAEVVTQASRGDRLVAESLAEAWVAIEPPERTDMWVYGDLVKGGEVAVSKLQVRSGPGINYRPVGSVERGARVTIRGKEGEWLKIAPPPACRLWVSSEYIRPVGGKPATPPPAPAVSEPVMLPDAVADAAPMPAPPTPAPTPPAGQGARPTPRPTTASIKPAPPTPAADALPIPRPPVAASLPAVAPPAPVAPPASSPTLALTGTVAKAGLVWRRPSRFRLLRPDSRGQLGTACYLAGDERRIEALLTMTVRVSGQPRWVEGVRHPLLQVYEIEAESAPPPPRLPSGWIRSLDR